MGEMSKREIIIQKEKVIQALLNKKLFKSSDNRQLYELTLSELENEFRTLNIFREY